MKTLPNGEIELEPFESIREMLICYIGILRDSKEIDNPKDKCDNEHLLWMLQELQDINETEEYPNALKFMRWVGFIQGVMIMKGYLTVDEERDNTRSLFTQHDMLHNNAIRSYFNE